MRKIILPISIIFLISCKPAKILLEENILRMELSQRFGVAPLTIEAKCEIASSIKEVPCLDEEWYCWPGDSLTEVDYINRIFVENECSGGPGKRNFSMDFTFDSPGRFTIELVLKKKNGEVFARISSLPVIVKSR